MKKIIQLIFCGLLSTVAIAQANYDQDISSEKLNTPERSETLNLLYEQAKYLENSGTAVEIEQNRLDIKNEWEKIDPEIAELYKPVEISISEENFPKIQNIDKPSSVNLMLREWSDDLLIRDGFIDGVDMEVTQTGDIYIAGFENISEGGDVSDHLFIYKSTNHGVTFEEWQNVTLSTTISKLQIISFDGEGDEYLLAYLMLEDGTFMAIRFVMSTMGIFDFDVINEGISDFAVDRNFPENTQNMTTFFSYLKEEGCDTRVYSARSTAGNFGMEIVDEVGISNLCGNQIDLSYGRSGATYMAFLGATTNNLYAVANNNFNDPASWEPYEVIELGSIQENVNPVIKATRKNMPGDEVLIFLQGRDVGTSDGYKYIYYTRENSNDYTLTWAGFPIGNQSAGPIDAWIKKEADIEIIQTTYIQDFIVNSSNDLVRSFTYDGSIMVNNEIVSDLGFRAWSEFPAVIAETKDGLPCLAFNGFNGNRAYNLYFDRESELLSLSENNIENLHYYPNPTTGILTVKASNSIEKVELYTITGNKIKEYSPNLIETNLNLSDFSSGLYLMTVKSNNQKETFKIIKK